ncbi:MAG: hypothetical protein GXY83_00495 [Rhodopirellula sp.]|nr:hypothetical protein [Rhodopirellula sp.]
MTLSETLATLEQEGVRVTSSQLDYWLRTGKLPDVVRDGAGNRVFSRGDLGAIRRYAQSPRPRGRAPRVAVQL